jgi:hypothetical protein
MTHAIPQPKPPRVRRAPAGTVNNKPIPVRLLPVELKIIKEIAQREQRSMASVCRLALLRGLADYPHTQLAA